MYLLMVCKPTFLQNKRLIDRRDSFLVQVEYWNRVSKLKSSHQMSRIRLGKVNIKTQKTDYLDLF
jgi:hypothetical protein